MLCKNRKGLTQASDPNGQHAADVMRTGIFTVHPDTPLSEAADRMIANRISGLPVVDAAARLVGVITEADLLRALGVPPHHPTHNLWQTLEAMFAHQFGLVDVQGRVADVMVTDVIAVAPDTHVCEVIELLKRNRIKRVVVVDGQRRVVGIVTRSDLVKAFFDRWMPKSAGSAA